MKAIVCQYILFLVVIISFGYTNGGNIARRDVDNNGDENALARLINTIITTTKKVPFFGERLGAFLEWVIQAISLFEIATNGALARFLGGALPCTISLNGTVCSGLVNNGGFARVFMNVLDGVPPLLLPGFIKSIIALFIQLFIDPTMDVLFGGVVINN